jgi:hypothetical protein
MWVTVFTSQPSVSMETETMQRTSRLPVSLHRDHLFQLMPTSSFT